MSAADAPSIAIAVKAIGWVGQACFFSRFFFQWIASERAKRSIVPEVFWHLSIAGSALLAVYAWLGPHNVVFLATEVFTFVVSVRNLVILKCPGAGLRPFPLALAALGIAGGTAWALLHDPQMERMLAAEDAGWLTLGVTAQLIWSSRFILQWTIAERRGKAELTPAFFVTSLAGSVLLLTYALHIGDAVLVAGQVPGPLIYGRNLVLHARHLERETRGVQEAKVTSMVGDATTTPLHDVHSSTAGGE